MSTLWVVDGLRRGPTDAEMTVSDLARHMGVAHSTASRLVARAEEVGIMVRRATSATDHRRVAVLLTTRAKNSREPPEVSAELPAFHHRRTDQRRARRFRTCWTGSEEDPTTHSA